MESQGSTTAVVVIAHGSRAAEANDAHEAVAAQLSGLVGLPVLPAFLELAHPTLPDAVSAAVAQGAQRVLVLPFFLYPGRHLARDIPALVADAAERHPEVSIEQLDAFGADPGVVALLADQLRRGAYPAGPAG